MSDPGVVEVIVCRFDEMEDPGCREFKIGCGDWPFKGFVIRQGDDVYAYQNLCKHAGHPLNWQANQFLTQDRQQILCASHGALYEIGTGLCTAGPCPGQKLTPVHVEIKAGNVVATGPTQQR